MKLALADVDEDGLRQTTEEVSSIVGASNVLAMPIDVANLGEVIKLKEKVFEAWDEVRPRYIPYRSGYMLTCSRAFRSRS